MRYLISFVTSDGKEVGRWDEQYIPDPNISIVLGGSAYRDNKLFYYLLKVIGIKQVGDITFMVTYLVKPL